MRAVDSILASLLNYFYICTSLPQSTQQHLEEVQKTLSGVNSTLTCWGDDYTGSRDDFINQRYRSLLGNGSGSDSPPVLLYPMCVRTFQLGNTLGYYFNDVACAADAGLHFVGANSDFNIQHPEALEVSAENAFAFLKALPTIRVHPSPRSTLQALGDIKEKCNCLQYCWENKAAPWSRHLDLISEIINHAIDEYIIHVDVVRGTTINNSTDLCSRCDTYGHRNQSSPLASARPHLRINDRLASTHRTKHSVSGLPLIPEVAVQYRCGDNIGFGKTRYGLLPFKAISSRIPDTVKEIYVLADAANRNPNSVFSGRCGHILEALYKHLVARFPFALIVVKRGGDVFLDVARMARAKVLICSASTFCLWPALANPNVAYFPLTPLVLGAWTNATAPRLTKQFHWIEDYQQLKEFKHFRPWSKVVDALET